MTPFIKVGELSSWVHQAVNPARKITMLLYVNKSVDGSGTTKPSYDRQVTMAVVQIPSMDELTQTFKITAAGVYKSFRINNNILKGLNRNINKAQDGIEFENMTYSIEFIGYEALNDYTWIVAREDVNFGKENTGFKKLPSALGVDILK